MPFYKGVLTIPAPWIDGMDFVLKLSIDKEII